MNPPPPGSGVIYECPDCETRYLASADARTATCSVDASTPAVTAPYCDEPVAISDLAEPTTPTTPQAVIMTT